MSIIKQVPQFKQRSEYLKCASDPVYFLNTYGKVFDAEKQMISDMTCFSYQEDVLDDFIDFRFNITLKSRQCLPIGTYVNVPNGIKSIEKFKIGDPVWSYNISSEEKEKDKVFDAWKSGMRDCVTLKLRDTRNITIGKKHPLFIKGKGWVKAKDLIKGDQILFEKPSFGNVSPRNSYVIALGYMITDGSAISQPKFTNNNLNYIDEFCDCVKELTPNLQIRKVQKCNGYDVFPHQEHGSSTKNSFKVLCEDMGVNVKSEYKILPEEVFSWNKKSTSLLLNRMFAGDGWVSIYKNGGSKRLEIGLGSPCREYLYQVKNLLLKFGITSNVYEITGMKKQKNNFWKLRVTHSKACKLFIEEISIYDKVKEEHFEIVNSYKHDVKYDSVVKSIKDAGKILCYDISVEKNENFFIDGLLTHNTGLSVVTAGYCAWRLMFGKDERVLVIANDGAGAIRFLETCKQFIDYLPDFLKPPKVGTSIYKTENKKMLQFYNNCQIEAKAASPQAGRGEALTLLVLDEVAFIKDAPDIWKAASTALSMTKGDAILISTPWGTGNLYHDIWTKAEAKINDFHPVEIHWTQNPIASKNLEWRIDDEGEKYPWSPWYEEQCTRLNNDPIAIAQELDLSFEGSKHLVVDAKILRKYKDRIKNEGIEPLCYFDWKVDSSNFTYDITPFYIWELPIEGHNYIIGGDVSRGDGRDFSTLQILDVETMTQVGEVQIKVDPDQLADIVYKVAQVYNNAFVAIEVNSMGSATTFRLKNQLKYTNQFFCKNYKDFYVKASSYKEAAMYKDGALVPGFQTTTKTRPLMMANLIQIMRERQVIINSKRLLNEFDTFVKVKDKEQHEKGFNDDLIFAWAIALYMRNTEYENATKSREQAKQMMKYFNLNGKSPMRDNTPASVRRPKRDGEEDEEGKRSKGVSPIIFGGSRSQSEEDDINWLYD